MLRVCAKRSCTFRSPTSSQGGNYSIASYRCTAQRRLSYSNTRPPRAGSHPVPFVSGRIVLAVPIVGYSLGCAWYVSKSFTTQCTATTVEAALPETSFTILESVDMKQSLWEKVRRGIRMLRRVMKLMIAFGPVATLYPLISLLHMRNADEDAKDIVMAALEKKDLPGGFLGLYYRLCLYCVEWSGAAAIKLFQWAGSRPDMFGDEFCRVFSQLQDDTTPHSWKHTEKALREAYGEDWEEFITINEILGSGCIAQVYKGVVLDKDGKKQEVAVKVMHPNVQDDIEADLDLMRVVVRVMEYVPLEIFSTVRWLNLPGVVEEIAGMLKIQLDLRTEADHLNQFNRNFADSEIVVFPKLVEGYPPTSTVLFETYCEGIPALEFAKRNQLNPQLLKRICREGVTAVCEMLFLHNFTHGDLHPGNILVSPDNKLILLDVGIVVENTERDYILISDILGSFIKMDGRKAGQFMIDDSNAKMKDSNEKALDEERFIEKIEAITVKANGKDYFMEHLGAYITKICNAAAEHHVMINQAFISACLAVKLQEGVALAFDPSIEIWRIAIPIILEGERRRGMITKRATEMFGLSRVFGWFTDERSSDDGKKGQIENFIKDS